MIGTLIGIIFLLIVIALVWWAIQALLGAIPVPEPFRTVIRILLILIFALIVLWIISILLSMMGIPINMGVFRPFR